MKKLSKALALLLAVVVLLGAMPLAVFAEELNTEKEIVIIAGSDFQDPDDKDANASASSANVNTILSQIKKVHPTADALIFCGDYDKDLPSTNVQASTTALKNTVKAVFSGMSEDNMYLVQGNHDQVAQGTNGLTGPGSHDTADYGVYIIDEDDYQWSSGASKTKIQATALKLGAYLTAKALQGYDKPIFVASHVPLHFSPRTQEGDAKYASYIFDVLQTAGAAGLNIIFLYGHDHSQGWDNYMGGAAVYLPVGHDINICNNTAGTSYETHQLNFTYMNAGFVGYYADFEPNTDAYNISSGVDKSLTMTCFVIKNGTVTVERYDENGIHNLKSEGKPNVKHTARTQCDLMTDVLTSPQYILLKGTAATEAPTEPATEPANEMKTWTDAATGITLRYTFTDEVPFAVGTQTVPAGLLADAGLARAAAFDFAAPGYPVGETTFVSIPMPEGWSAVKTSAYYLNGTKLEKLATRVENGYATFKTTHFSTYLLGESNAEPLTDPVVVDIAEKSHVDGYLYELYKGTPNADDEYLIVSTGSNNRYYMISGTKGTLSSASVTVSNNKIQLSQKATGFTISGSSIKRGSYTLRHTTKNNSNDNTLGLSSNKTNFADWTISSANATTGNRTISYTATSRRYLSVGTSAPSITTTSTNVRLFRYTGTNKVIDTPASRYYLWMTDVGTVNVKTGTYTSQAALENYLKTLVNVYKADTQTGTKSAVGYTLKANTAVNPTTEGTVTYTVSYDGHTVGTFKVVLQDAKPISMTVAPMSGSVYRKANNAAKTGAVATVVYDNGTTELVDVTVGMLSGSFDVKTATENEGYTGLTVTYKGMTVEGFTLEVLPLPNEVDFPEYPNEGSVHVDKTGHGIDFQSSGIAVIELSAAGIPMKKGVDIIVMVDTSSSMEYGAKAGTQTVSSPNRRIDFLHTALNSMVDELKKENADGTAVDTRIAIADFNGYASSANIDNYIGSKVSSTSNPNKAKLYTGENSGHFVTENGVLNADAFVDVATITPEMIKSITTESGTNYDSAFDTVYKLGEAIKAKNAEEGIDRDLVVVFMSDGSPYQYNGIQSTSSNAAWNDYMNGVWTNEEFRTKYTTVKKPEFYNGKDNLHRTAEAIKGNTGDTFDIISFNASTGKAEGLKTVNGLGAALYSIGFCLFDDQKISAKTMNNTMRLIASEKDGEKLFYSTNSGADLEKAFVYIANDIKIAGTESYFFDHMGADYDLRLASETYELRNAEEQVIETKTIRPTIRVLTYKTYTANDIGTTIDGHVVTKNDVGNRYGEPTVVEVVSFNDAGTEAYSNVIGAGVNIMQNGIICAKNFYYNTTDTTVTMSHFYGAGYDDIELAPETFWWWLADITEEEKVLEYYVYLTGSMEGTRPAGSYPTNESATLYYYNWLDHLVHQDTVSPVLPWREAVVNFGFYLVDAEGNPVVNQSTGLAGSFTNRVIVVNKTQVPETINLNNGTGVSAVIEAQKYVPKGYTLFDPDASYQVQVNSNGGGGWHVNVGVGKALTTYVTDFGGNPTTQVNADDYDFTYDYSHTTVWFAVLFELKCVPDTVVIDYGKPVSIQALINDRFGIYGTLAGIGKRTADVPETTFERRDTLPAGFGKNLTLDFGTAAVTANNTVTYTLGGMQMTDAETFTYAVRYNDLTNENNPNNGYYFADITVVPATIIYFEESFVQLNGDWMVQTNGTPVAGQAEDRPGSAKDNPANADADNVYGYDAGYNGNTVSNGTQYATTVYAGMQNWPTATFTFTGTGFDIISVTDKMQGFVTVEVFGENGSIVTYERYDPMGEAYDAEARWGVDCYYGYKSVEQVGWIKFMCRYTDGWHANTKVVTEKKLGVGEVEVSKLPAQGEYGKVYVMYEPAYDWTKSDENVTLYQIPIIKSRDALPFGTYKVVVTPMYSTYFDHVKDDNAYNFVLDAIRIYDPAGVHEIASYENNVNKYYLEDNEAWPQFIELRDTVVGQDAFSGSETVSGSVFVDAFGKGGAISDYNNFGPNNEVYLAPGQSIAFRLMADAADVAAVHMATKCVTGTVNYTVNGTAMTTDSCTDLYYDITKLVKWNGSLSDIIVITNTGDTIQSITNLKITFNAKPDFTAMLQAAREDVAAVLAMIEKANLGEDVDFDGENLFNWVYGQQLTVGNAAYKKAPIYTANANFASTGIIPYIPGETDVVNLGYYDIYTSARVLWVNADGLVIGSTASFAAGKDVNINSLATNGTKNGAVGYMLTAILAQTAAKAPAAFEVVAANSVISGYVETEAPTEAPTEPAEEPAEGVTGWHYGVTAGNITSALRKTFTMTAAEGCAVLDPVAYTAGEPCTVNLGKYDRYTSARVMWIDKNGTVIGVSSSFQAGKDVDVNTLPLNGTRNGAVSIALTVQLCGSASKGAEAFTVVAENTVIK